MHQKEFPRHAGKERSSITSIMINNPLPEKCSWRRLPLHDPSSAQLQDQKLTHSKALTHSQTVSLSSDFDNPLQWRGRAFSRSWDLQNSLQWRANPICVTITARHPCWDQDELLGRSFLSVNVVDGAVGTHRLVHTKRNAKRRCNLIHQVEGPLQWRGNTTCISIMKSHRRWDQEDLLGGSCPPTDAIDGTVPLVDVVDGAAGIQKFAKRKRKVKGLPNGTREDEEEADASTARHNSKKRRQDDAMEIVALLKDCAQRKDVQTGSRLHAEIVGKGLLEKNDFIGSTLVHMYIKCGALEKARDVFDKLPGRDNVTWTALVGGYAQHGNGEEALNCFQRMQHEGIAPDMLTFSCILKACSGMGEVQKGQEIYARTVKDCLVERNLVLANVLVDMYAKCGDLERAQQVFDELPVRDAVSWTTLITGYAQAGRDQEAVLWFRKMQERGLSPSIATFLSVLKACGSMGVAEKGQEVHSQIVKEGLHDGNTKVANALIAMYGKLGLFVDAEQMCEGLKTRDIITWNTLIGGYTQHGHGKEALDCFGKMLREGFCPNGVTYTSTVKACGIVGASNRGMELYAQISKQHLLENNVIVANALIDMFSKCGLLRKAQEVFDKLPVKDNISWNALIVGHGQQGHEEEALACFELMELEGFTPDTITFPCILKACGAMGAVGKGQEIHARVVCDGLMDETMVISTALVDMYAKNGMLTEAQEIFDNLQVHDVVSWNALLIGYSQLGDDEVVFCLLDKLIKEGNEPDSVTFTAVLNTCSHGGLLDEGQFYFVKLSETHDIAPSLEHLTCMIDLFCRAGHFNLATTLIEIMPLPADKPLWLSFSSACERWEERWAFESVTQADSKVNSVKFAEADMEANPVHDFFWDQGQQVQISGSD